MQIPRFLIPSLLLLATLACQPVGLPDRGPSSSIGDWQKTEVIKEGTPTATPSQTPVLTNKPANTPPAKLTGTPTPTVTTTPQLVAEPLQGRFVFDLYNAQSSSPGAGAYAYEVTNLCIPQVTIALDGSVSGECRKSNAPGHLVATASFTALVTGQVDPAGNITFSYDVSEIGNPNGVWRVLYQGQGKFTSKTQAEGTASFSYTCNSGADNLLWCASSPSSAFIGITRWTFGP